MATGSTTNYHFPYPLGSDSLSNVALRIQELAEYIDTTYTTLGINLSGSAALMQVGDPAGGALTGSYPNPTIDPSVPLPDGTRATTQAQSDNSTKIATTAYVDAYIAGTVPDGSINTAELADGAVTNIKVNTNAAISYSKLNLSNSIVNTDVATGAAIAYSKLALAGSIQESDLAFSVATQSELDTHTSATTSVHGISNTANLVYTSDSRLSDQRVPTDGSVTNAKVAAGAAIAYSKLNLTGAILNTDLAGSIAYSKLSLTNSIVNGDIVSVALAKVTGAGTAASRDVPATGDASATQVVLGSDTRLTNSRTPTSHASTHASAGSDPITISPSQVTGTAVITTDSRLSDARTPTTHATTHVPGGSDAIDLTKIVDKGTVLPTSFTLYPAGALFALGAAAPYLLYRSTGTAWEAVGGSGGSISVSDTAPSTPSNGNLWFDSTTGKTFIWYADGSSNQWVEVGENAQVVIPGHGSSHVRGGSDVIDGDRLTIDYVPTNYTRNAAASGAGNATDLTAHLSGIDNLFGPWNTWTSYTIGGFTVGNALKEGKYIQIGKTVAFWTRTTLGSTSAVTGQITISVPVPASTSHNGVFKGNFFDSGTGFPLMQPWFDGVVVNLYAVGSAAAYASAAATSATVPMTWATGDAFYCAGIYEAA